MKRSDMIKDIASELVCEYTNFMSFDKAQDLANVILNRIEKEGMCPPPDETIGTSSLGIPCQWEYEGEYHE